ncbi:SDR family NAD(P)-dependent oxidoreductase [Halorarius litoreus]|uniref:SDR family NAD(P)-dependent oxidoreductase n=1 Tax=Halorarius litoreus TaxID=2962676 RepID=UPI0020CE1D7D|nr:SDR family NAD(P)-dependent oxidoreductase [Halorarius litoreus]
MTTTAVVAGVGPGLGAAVVRRFDAAGWSVGLFARSSSYIETLADELDHALAVETDIADPDAVAAGFEAVREAFGPVDVLVLNASAASWKGTLDISPDEFDTALDVNVRGALSCVQEAVPDMLDAGDGGTVIFTGATTSVRGRKGAIGFSAAKFAARGMAESMARELGPQGIHVAHVVIDGGIRPPSMSADADDAHEYLDPDAIADAYWQLVEQDRRAWTLELDLRPHVEEF